MFYDVTSNYFQPDPQTCAACGIECDLVSDGMCGPCADTTIELTEGPVDPIQAALTSPVASNLYATGLDPIKAIQTATIRSQDVDGLTLADCLSRLNPDLSTDLASRYARMLKDAVTSGLEIAPWMLINEILSFEAPKGVVEAPVITPEIRPIWTCSTCNVAAAPVEMGLCVWCADALQEQIDSGDAADWFNLESVCAACGDEWATVPGSLCAPCLSEFNEGFDPIEPVNQAACEWPGDHWIADEHAGWGPF